ncbi:MAG: esterase [Bacteroidales bacterium]|nr:esterase [Bacteroidales bacterium]
MAGKKILYVHGFASSGQTGSVKTLRLLLPDATVIAPDLPVEPEEAMGLLRSVVSSEKPDLVIGTSMGAMYSEMLYGIDRVLVNPAFQLADTLLRNNGLGRREFHNPRSDGETSFLVTKTLLDHFREVSSHCFGRASEDSTRVYGLFGIRDNLVHTFDLFREHYPQAIRFDGEHHLNDSVMVHSLLPVIQRIDDRQNGVSRPMLFISLSDRLVNHSSGMPKAVEILSQNYETHIFSGVDYNFPEKCADVFAWCESNLGVPVWNRVEICNHKNLLLGDFLIDAEPEVNGGQEFMGTVIHFGSDTFKTWEDILTFFSRLCGQ